MKTIKGPAIFLAQFLADNKPFNNLDSISKWAKELGYKAIQIPTWDSRVFDLETAGKSKTYCDEIKGIVSDNGLEISELSTHLQGQLIATHPSYDIMFDSFAPKNLHGKVGERTMWAKSHSPINSAPFGILPPSLVYFVGFLRKSTISLTSSLAPSRPATSLKLTLISLF